MYAPYPQFLFQMMKKCFYKVDKDYPDNLLAGAIFEIYMDVDGNKEFNADVDTLVGEMVEYEPGLYELENLRYGGYFLYEKQAPANYVKDDAYHYFAIVNDGEMVHARREAEAKLHDPVILEYWDSLTEERKKEFQDYLRNT